MNKFVFVGKVISLNEKSYGDKGRKFGLVTVESGDGQIEFSCFGGNFSKFQDLKKGDIVKMTGRIGSNFSEKHNRHFMRLNLDEHGLELQSNSNAPKQKAEPPVVDPFFDEGLPF